MIGGGTDAGGHTEFSMDMTLKHSLDSGPRFLIGSWKCRGRVYGQRVGLVGLTGGVIEDLNKSFPETI